MQHFEANVHRNVDGQWWADVYPLVRVGEYLTPDTFNEPVSMVPLDDADMEQIGVVNSDEGDDWYGTDNGTMPMRLGEILAPVFERLRSE